MSSAPAAPTPVRGRGASKSLKIGVGLLLTFVGIALLSLLLPTDPGGLVHLLPVVGGGILLLWVGGILMGIGSRS